MANIYNGKRILYKTYSDHLIDDIYLKLLTHPLAFCMFQRGDYILHASAISIQNKAYLFIGPSTVGKSFTAGSMLKYGKFITEDIARINLKDDPYIFNGPPIIKLSDEFFDLNSLDYFSKFVIKNDSRDRHGYVLKETLIANEKTKIEACFIIEPSSTNSVQRIGAQQAFKNILFNSFCGLPKNNCFESEIMMHKNINLFLRKVKIFKFNKANKGYDEFLFNFINKDLN